MKKMFLSILTIVASFFALIGSSCNIGNGVLGNNSGQSPQIETYEIYLDDTEKTFDKISIKVSCFESNAYSSNNKKLDIRLVCTNIDTAEKKMTISDMQILNEQTNVSYDVSVYPSTSVNLQYGIDNTFKFFATIPTSSQIDNYILSFSAGNNYKIHLYETPDELRKNCSVKFMMGANEVYTTQVKERRCLEKIYIWEDKNHLYYCDEWYIDEALTTKFKQTTKITEDLILYGRILSNISSIYDSGRFITDINHVPSDGILVIQENEMEANVYLSNFAIHDNSDVKEIYLPKTLTKIYFGNFDDMPNLKTIHYAGSKEEWELIQSSSKIPTNVTIVYNSSFIIAD